MVDPTPTAQPRESRADKIFNSGNIEDQDIMFWKRIAMSLHQYAIELEDNLAESKALYYELLWEVEEKIPNETRHQTALKQIRKGRGLNSLATSSAPGEAP